MERIKGAAWVLLSASGFGVMVLFSRTAATEGVDPASLLFMRLAIASLVLSAMSWRKQAVWPKGRAIWVAALMGTVFCGNALAYFMALNEGAAASVAAVFFSYPVFVALFGALWQRRWMDARSLWCTVLAVAGCWLTVSAGQGEPLAGQALGMALTSAVLYSVYVLLSRGLGTQADPVAQAGLITGCSAVCFGVLVAWQGLHHPVSWLGWGCVAGLAIVSTVVSITGFLAGARILGTTQAAALSAAEPVVTALTAWVAFGEALSQVAWLGMALVVGAVVLSTRARKADKAQAI